MGLALSIFSLIIGLIFLIFPGICAKIFRVGGYGFFYHNLDTLESNKKHRFAITPTTEHFFGKERAINIFRILGIFMIVVSVFAYFFSP